MTDYWEMSSYKNSIEQYNFSCFNCFYTFDRFCNPDSSLYLDNGYLKFPPKIYFNSDFTIILWINIKKQISDTYLSLIDFGNGAYSDNIIFGIYLFNSSFYSAIIKGSNYNRFIYQSKSLLEIKKDVWYHVAFALNKTTGLIYINGNQVAEDYLDTPRNVMRTMNYIGRSNFATSSFANAIFDDVKIYDGALYPNQIYNDFIANSYTSTETCTTTTTKTANSNATTATTTKDTSNSSISGTQLSKIDAIIDILSELKCY